MDLPYGDFTFALWFNAAEIGRDKQIVNWQSTIDGSYYHISVNDAPYGGVVTGLRSITGGGFDVTQCYSKTHISTDTWNFVVFTLQGNVAKLYVNNVLDTGFTYLQGAWKMGLLRFGAHNWDFGYQYKGKLDDIGIWSRALTPVEITGIYQNCDVNLVNQPKTTQLRVGEKAIFNAFASNLSAKYQWQTDLGAGFVNVSPSGQYTGATSSTLSVSDLGRPNDKQVFRCLVSSDSCTLVSDWAYLYVCDSAIIKVNDHYVALGDNLDLPLEPFDPLKVWQWQTNSNELGWQNLPENSKYSGTKSGVLKVGSVRLSNHAQPFRVFSKYSNCIDTSNIANLYLTDTCVTNLKIFDTIRTKITTYDTIFTKITTFDTITTKVTFYDTITTVITKFDTLITKVTVFDTIRILISVTDTLFITVKTNSINPLERENLLKIFPNPTNEFITIDFGNFALMKDHFVKIVSASGQTIFVSPINQQVSSIDLKTFAGKGLYFVQIFDAQNMLLESKKIVLQ